jgi:hypothetical protein
MIVMAEMFHELQNSSPVIGLFQSRRFFFRPTSGARRIDPPSTSCRLRRGY